MYTYYQINVHLSLKRFKIHMSGVIIIKCALVRNYTRYWKMHSEKNIYKIKMDMDIYVQLE
jgi:hypothetical protein